MIRDLMHIETPQQAAVLLHPERAKILELLQEPATAKELAQKTGFSPQRVNNYVKDLLEQGFVQVFEKKQVRNFIEHTYLAVAKRFWLSPQLVNQTEITKKMAEEKSLHNLLWLAEKLHEDTAALLGNVNDAEINSLGILGEVVLSSEKERHEFAQEYVQLVKDLISRYKGKTSDSKNMYTTMFLCYPKVEDETKNHKDE